MSSNLPPGGEGTSRVAPPGHVYTRDVSRLPRNSISVIAQAIGSSGRVLDIGAGAGALGALLRERATRLVAITHNAAEADACRPMYDRVLLLDLESPAWPEQLAGERFEAIVCADVLEHLRNPSAVLTQLHSLLADGGALHVSVPNMAYAGLIANLMRGRFDYGPEGLMDETHLRFFTRSSFMALLKSSGWETIDTDAIAQPLHETEYRLRLDELPPAVLRHLMAQPDASAYQLIFKAVPTASVAGAKPLPPHQRYDNTHAAPTYVAELFVGHPDAFESARRVTAFGVMGESRQALRFALPSSFMPFGRLRLDPADRPGYWHLHKMELLDAQGARVWCWDNMVDTPAAWRTVARHQMQPLAEQAAPEASGQAWLLMGDDPSIELPIPPDTLRTLPHQELELRVECGWPVSADYRAAIALLQQQAQAPATLPVSANTPVADSRAPATGQPTTRPGWLSRLARWTGLAYRQRPQQQGVGASICVVVPVYGNLAVVRTCLESVMNASNQASWRLIVIDDASPEPELQEWLRRFAESHRTVTCIRNTINLGFVKTVNLGMTLAGRNDVVLLNSDTEVHGNWLDRLKQAAWSQNNVGTVTPFSNNATICSFPRFCEDNPLPQGFTLAQVDQAFGAANQGQAVDIPTAVGFCMYIRRDCLDAVGLFDADTFGRGYGEENDFCLRASHAGWRHLHALDVFVRHFGGTSFGPERQVLQQQALEAMRRLHPHYETLIRDFVALDPAKPYRLAAEQALGHPHTQAGLG